MSGSDVSDGEGANSRSSPNRIASIVSNFSDLKKNLVTDICFNGMLKVPDIKSLDRRFTVWLLSKVDPNRRSIRVGDNTHIEITAADVHQFLDIPMGPNKLFGLHDRSPSEKMDFIRFAIGSSAFDIDEKNSLKAAEEIVSADYPDGMSENIQEQFQVSFVCFCMGHFLLGKYSLNHGIKDFWGSLMKPSEISTYNFCEAVVDEIIESARHVQREIKANKPIKNISGCNLFLQAKFLDSITLNNLMIPQREIPRVQFFTMELMKKMITNVQSNSTPATPKVQVQRAPEKPSSCNFDNGKKSIPCRPPLRKENSAPSSLAAPVKFKGNHSSSSYLAAYTRGEFEKRLNDQQIDDLKIHNARMRLFVHNFKMRSLSDLRASSFDISHSSKEAIFLTTVDNLLNQLLDQVLHLSKKLHEHSQVIHAHPIETPSILPSHKRSFDQITPLIGTTSDGNCNRRKLTTSFLYGKNLLQDLTNAALPSSSNCKTPSSLYPGGISPGISTPDGSTAVLPIISKVSDDSIIGIDELEFRSCSYSDFESPGAQNHNSGLTNIINFTTPEPSVGIFSRTTSELAIGSDVRPFDGIFDPSDDLDQDDNDITNSPINKILIKEGPMARNPWLHAAAKKIVEPHIAEKLFQWLLVTRDSCLDSLWIIHSSTREIKIAGNDFKSVFTKGFNFTKDMLDICIRRFEQMDRFMYGDGVHLRWIHPFESDLSVILLNVESPMDSRSVRLQVQRSCEDYQICQCRMIAVPINLNSTWSCYFWDMKEHVVHIVDPTFQDSKADEFHLSHDSVVDKLHVSIQSCLTSTYDGWHIEWNKWSKNYAQPFLPDKSRNYSGLLTMLAMRYFNGSKFEISQSEESLSMFAKQLLYNMLTIEGNQGKIPNVLIQDLQ